MSTNVTPDPWGDTVPEPISWSDLFAAITGSQPEPEPALPDAYGTTLAGIVEHFRSAQAEAETVIRDRHAFSGEYEFTGKADRLEYSGACFTAVAAQAVVAAVSGYAGLGEDRDAALGWVVRNAQGSSYAPAAVRADDGAEAAARRVSPSEDRAALAADARHLAVALTFAAAVLGRYAGEVEADDANPPVRGHDRDTAGEVDDRQWDCRRVGQQASA